MLKGVPLGVANMTPVNLDQGSRSKILDAVGNPDDKKADFFIQHIETAISVYLATKDLDQNTKPSVVRKRLLQLRDTADKLRFQVDKLDGISQRFVDDFESGTIRSMKGHIQRMILCFSEARIKATKLPNFRHVDYPTRFLARDVGLAMLECLDLRPTKTRDTCDVSGKYNKCLVAVMEASGRRPNTDMMRVMQAGIALLNATLPTAT